MASSLTTFDAFLKDNYDKETVTALVNKDRPFLAKLKKSTGSGRRWIVPAIISNPQGHGALLSNAQTASNQTTGGTLQGVDWTINWGDYSSAVSIGDKVIAASKDNIGAFFEDKKAEIDRLYEQFADIMAAYAVGDQGHSVTPGTFTISTGVCTLSNPDDISLIEKGMIMNASANAGNSNSDTLLGSGSSGFVIATNRNAGTFTVSTTSGGSAGTPSGWTGTMYGFRQGDFGGSGATRIMLGYRAWVPVSDPSSTTFEGLDRTVAMTELSGVRLTSAEIAGVNIEQRIKKLVTRMAGRGRGPGPTDIFLQHEKWQALADSLESRGIRPLDGKIGTFNYEKLQVTAGGKRVDIWADRFVAVNECLAPNMDYLELKTLDGFPKIVNGDGLTMLRASTTNDYEFRLASYPAFCARGPGFCGRTAV